MIFQSKVDKTMETLKLAAFCRIFGVVLDILSYYLSLGQFGNFFLKNNFLKIYWNNEKNIFKTL